MTSEGMVYRCDVDGCGAESPATLSDSGPADWTVMTFGLGGRSRRWRWHFCPQHRFQLMIDADTVLAGKGLAKGAGPAPARGVD